MQSNFKRYEKKYLLTREQYDAFRNILSQYMEPDIYGEYLVQNLYYDTAGWDVIRASIEKPLYKEKLRLRCYGLLSQGGELFLELKKKYNGVVYKRRIAIPSGEISVKDVRDIVSGETSQISRELDFYLKSNAVCEKIYISYRRMAYATSEGKGPRVTFDADVCFRVDCLDFAHPGNGYIILPQGKTLMEIKSLGGMPLWMTRALSENGIFPTSFSKYGACYIEHILKESRVRPNWRETGAERTVLISA